MLSYTFLGHSGFLFEFPRFFLLVDYFKDEARMMDSIQNDPRPLLCLATHSHQDHFNPDILSFKHNAGIYYVLDESCKHSWSKKNWGLYSDYPLLWVKAGEQLDLGEALAKLRPEEEAARAFEGLRLSCYKSTDEGSAFLFEYLGELLFHAGDLNDWDWQDEDSPAMELAFRKSLLSLHDDLRKRRIDYAFFPVDERLGQTCFKGPSYFLEHFQPRHYIPMHNFGQNLAQAELRAVYEGNPISDIQGALKPGTRILTVE
ncbi:MAG: MBL fold metallo-hydrolase [Eubacteriales bacterium]|nr:MBL fold metallo-hydrolase [Eubacteriales bacterium]